MKSIIILLIFLIFPFSSYCDERINSDSMRHGDRLEYRFDESKFMTRGGSYFILGPRFNVAGSENDFEQAEKIFKKSSGIAFQYFNESRSWYKAYRRTAIVGGSIFLVGMGSMIVVAITQKKTNTTSNSSGDFNMSPGLLVTVMCTYTSMFFSMIAAGIQMHMTMRYADMAIQAYNNQRRVSFTDDFRFDRIMPPGQKNLSTGNIQFSFPVLAFQF